MVMEVEAQISLAQPNTLDLPALVLEDLFLQVSTPTFIQLLQSSKEFRDFALQHRPILLHHLHQIPGRKADLANPSRINDALLRQLRQRAANHLYGLNFTANMTEFLTRNARLVPEACSIAGLDADYVRTALVFRNTTDIRQYTADCIIKERISLDPKVKIIKLVQWSRYISVLCSMDNSVLSDELCEQDDHDDNSDSDLDSDAEDDLYPALKPTAQTRLMRQHYRHRDCDIGTRKSKKINDIAYRVCHYDVYTLEDSQTFEVKPYLDYVPRDFAVSSTLCCAILWDKDNQDRRPTEHATLMYYDARKQQLYYATTYDAKKLWPKEKLSSRRSSDASDAGSSNGSDDSPEFLVAGIEFFRYGHRIKLYDAGGIVPFEVVSVKAPEYDRYGSTNEIDFPSCSFHVDTPFYGTHARYHASDDTEMCVQTHLCLGTTTIDLAYDADMEDREARVLCILRSQTKDYSEDCEHRVELQKMYHVGSNNATVVARLWGFEEMQTSLTGKNMVAISQGGTRIAIAMWNKVYIYALNPKILCDEVVVDDGDEEAVKRKKKKKSKRPWETPATDYYARRKDSNLMDWKIADLKPVVLDLKGAVAHKMSWSPPSGPITDTAEVEEELAVGSIGPKDTSLDTVTGSSNGYANAQMDTGEALQTAVSDTTATATIQHPNLLVPVNQISAGQVLAVPQLAGEITQTPSPICGHLPIESNAQADGYSSPGPSLQHVQNTFDEPHQSTLEKETSSAAANSTMMQPNSTPRKKDKGPEATTSETVSSPKKTTKCSHSVTLSPVNAEETKATVSEVNKDGSLPGALFQQSAALISESVASQPSPSNTEVAGNSQQEEVPLCNNSKDAQPRQDGVAQAANEKPQGDVLDDSEEADIESKHKKRITEDELIILTDRGVQIWNLGAKARGLRIQKYLKLEEPTKDLIPRWALNNGRLAWPPPEDDVAEPEM